MFIETSKYASEWMVNVAHDIKPVFSAIGVFEVYDYDENVVKKHPSLRDRTEEYERMVAGVASGKADFFESLANIQIRIYTGLELKSFGFDPVGAQFMKKYLVVVC